MTDPRLERILQHLQATEFHDLSGTTLSAAIPISEALLNTVISETMPTNLPVRAVALRLEEGNRLAVRLTPRAGLLPQITLKLIIERQPDLPGNPELVLRMATLPGLFGLAGAAFPIARMLPPGVRLQGELFIVDLRAVAEQHGVTRLLDHVTAMEVHSQAGRLVIRIEVAVR